MTLTVRGLLPTLLVSLCLAAVTASAQTAPATAPAGAKPMPLSQEQKLEIENDAKDVKLAQQQLELLAVQVAAARVAEQRSEQTFAGFLAKLRTDMNAPASSWDFDAASLSFVPKGYKPPAAPGTAKPASSSTAAGSTAKKPGGGQ